MILQILLHCVFFTNLKSNWFQERTQRIVSSRKWLLCIAQGLNVSVQIHRPSITQKILQIGWLVRCYLFSHKTMLIWSMATWFHISNLLRWPNFFNSRSFQWANFANHLPTVLGHPICLNSAQLLWIFFQKSRTPIPQIQSPQIVQFLDRNIWTCPLFGFIFQKKLGPSSKCPLFGWRPPKNGAIYWANHPWIHGIPAADEVTKCGASKRRELELPPRTTAFVQRPWYQGCVNSWICIFG